MQLVKVLCSVVMYVSFDSVVVRNTSTRWQQKTVDLLPVPPSRIKLSGLFPLRIIYDIINILYVL
jgi:hypothetical protein